jgi:aminopeptidase
MSYVPPPEILQRYADVLVNLALGGGAGIRRGDVVEIIAPESAKPFYAELCRTVWRAGGHVIGRYVPDDGPDINLTRDFYAIADGEQLDFFPARYRRGLVDEVDHAIHVLSDAHPQALAGVDPARILRHRRSFKPLNDWQDEKENAGRFSWTIALYGTEAMAREARLTLEEYWEEIVAACFLDQPDPKARWAEVNRDITRYATALNDLPIDRLHIEGEDADLWITLGERRRWIGGGGRNVPSFEIFTSPDWRGTEGWIRFTEPLYVYGSLITGIRLEFAQGRVTSATAEENQPLLEEMVGVENADRVGEFSLTDARLSRITRFMAETLYDENVGGPFGNTHLALGQALHPCYAGDPAAVSSKEWEALGFNSSATHTDIVQTSDRTVTAVLRDGRERVIYAGGRFQFDE